MKTVAFFWVWRPYSAPKKVWSTFFFLFCSSAFLGSWIYFWVWYAALFWCADSLADGFMLQLSGELGIMLRLLTLLCFWCLCKAAHLFLNLKCCVNVAERESYRLISLVRYAVTQRINHCIILRWSIAYRSTHLNAQFHDNSGILPNFNNIYN